ncbi:MAG: hypothetical protein FWE33_06940 [Defluviitaleaceae bacterium]|nr:hypothetical protein [Defluviitaleaceae bacterium]
MWNFIDEIINLQDYQLVAAIGLVGLFLLCVLLRIILTISYQTTILLINNTAKGIKSKEGILKLPIGAFSRAAKDYMELAQSGAKVDALQLAEMSVRKNRLLFFNFSSLGRFVTALETAFVPLAILIAISMENFMQFTIFSGGLFVILRIIAAIFDVQTAKERYTTVLATALTREVGKFFPADATSAIYTFSADVKEYLSRQSAMYTDLLVKINTDFSEAVKTNISAMTASVEATLFAVSRHDGLGVALDEIKNIGIAAAAFSASISDANKGMARLADVAVLEQSLDLVKKNQEILAQTVAHYETSLQDVTAKMGDALGKIISYHLSNTNIQIADNINENLNQSRAASIGQIEEVKAIFAELAEQNRQQTRLLMNLIRSEE